jgi:N-acetyl-gamma-glutamyl-phosphate reductase
MVKIGIVGASGYTGGELIHILLQHPEVEIEEISALLDEPVPISNIFRDLRKRFDMECKIFKDAVSFGTSCELIFLALPHKVSMNLVPEFIKANKRVIDLSADFRLMVPEIYSKWYSVKHTAPQLLSEAVYGLPELYRDRIKGAKLIANPGCYPTTVILGCAPLLKHNLVEPNIIVDAKSGISGAGATPTSITHFVHRYENFTAYNVGKHRHIPEMEQELSKLADTKVKIMFIPHLIPINRGLLSTIYLQPVQEITTEEIVNLYQEFYKYEPFIRIVDTIPQTHDVRETNYCDIWIDMDKHNNKIIIISAIDNLTKGASGQAVQNMNIMYDWDDTTGLI